MAVLNFQKIKPLPRQCQRRSHFSIILFGPANRPAIRLSGGPFARTCNSPHFRVQKSQSRRPSACCDLANQEKSARLG